MERMVIKGKVKRVPAGAQLIATVTRRLTDERRVDALITRCLEGDDVSLGDIQTALAIADAQTRSAEVA